MALPAPDPARGFGPSSRIDGALRVPTSKSIAQRVLVAAALSGGRTRLAAVPDARDVEALLDALASLGAGVERLAPRAVTVRGVPPGPERGFAGTAAVGESGTAARLVSAAAAFCGRRGAPIAIGVQGTLRSRSSAPLMRALERAGVRLTAERAGAWPVAIEPLGPPSEVLLEEPVSSQEASALLIALAAWPGEHLLRVAGRIPSRPYLELTRAVLERFGAYTVAFPAEPGEEAFLVRGPLVAPPDPILIEPDASAAAVALAAACLSGGAGHVSGLGPRSAQGDVAIVDGLAAFGCTSGADAGRLFAGGRPLRGAELDLAATPDLAPVLAAVAAAAALEHGAESLLTGLETLPGKESSRIVVLAEGLTALGLSAEAGADRLAIARGSGSSGPVLLDPRGDHRMAFAFALLGLVREGVWVRDPGCVAKSWPSFWRDLERSGARPPGLALPAVYPPPT